MIRYIFLLCFVYISVVTAETFSLGRLINIKEGADLYLRLPEDTDEYETCKLYGPDDVEVLAEQDRHHYESCGFIVRNVDETHNGTWAITYGNVITHKGTVEVNVLGSTSPDNFNQNEDWFLGSAIDKIVGPKDAVYCRLEDHNENTIFDGFGACRIKLDRVTSEHHGMWTATYGLPGAVLAQSRHFLVRIIEADPIPVVTDVWRLESSAVLSCSIPQKYNVTGCKFRDPKGNIMVASHNVGEEGFVFDGTTGEYVSKTALHECTLRVVNPKETHVGLWRCAVDTTQGTYYGFLDVREMIGTHEDEAITEPVINDHRLFVMGLVGDPIYMSCSIAAPLRYCYFTSENGNVYSVGPATSSENYEYVGSGLDAGECGMRIRGLRASDSGRWTCNVGLANSERAREQSVGFIVGIEEKLQVAHYWREGAVIVASRVYYGQPLDYCRFVRRDGFGFTIDNLPRGYKVERWSEGACDLVIEKPQTVDRHPWTVVVKLRGHDGEIQATTPVNFLVTGSMPFSVAFFIWVMVTMVCLILLAVGLALVPKKNREWTSNRASRIRNSLRRAPPPPVPSPQLPSEPPAYTEEPVKRPEDQNHLNPAV